MKLRCVAVHTGAAADAVTAGSHLNLNRFPDCLAYDGAELLGWGFRDNDWR